LNVSEAKILKTPPINKLKVPTSVNLEKGDKKLEKAVAFVL
jgi:hypothetical protein